MSPACLINIGLCLVCVFITPEYFFGVYTMEYSHNFCIDLFLLHLQRDASTSFLLCVWVPDTAVFA